MTEQTPTPPIPHSSLLPPHSTLGVVGSGTMGGGIAQVAAQRGFSVLLYDISDELVNRSITRLQDTLGKLAAKGKLTADEVSATMGRIRATANLEDLAAAQFVIEAAPENIPLKRDIFARLDAACPPQTILASNTSSLSITMLGGATKQPERVVGMHFFNPVPLMGLVEVIAGQYTSGDTVDATMTMAQQFGKTPVRCQDTPGFIVNRVARNFYGEALRILGEQGATVAQIDTLAEQEAGFRMGPFRLMDLIGIDINFAVTQSVYNAYFGEPRYRPHPIQQRMVESGAIGRKAGRGFYDYAAAKEANK